MDRSFWPSSLCLGVLLILQVTGKCYIQNMKESWSDIQRSESETMRISWTPWTGISWNTGPHIPITYIPSEPLTWVALHLIYSCLSERRIESGFIRHSWLSSFSHSLLGYGTVIIFLKSFYYNHYIGTAHKIALTTSHEDRRDSKWVWFILNMWFQTADTEYTQAITELIKNNTCDPRALYGKSR